MTGKNRPPTTEETLINKLPFGVVKMLSLSLDIDKKWERFVTKIPKQLNDVCKVRQPDCEMRYSHLQIRLFEEKLKRPDGSPTNAIINDWATQNPRVKHLLRVLQEASLYEAADYLSVNVLHQCKVPRLSDDPSMEKSASLPLPTWNDAKMLTDDENKIAASNFNSQKEIGVKENELYKKKDMEVDDDDYGKRNEDSTYTGLNRESLEDQHGYRMLGPNNNMIYNKGPSYTSGEKSMLLEGGNPLNTSSSTDNDLMYDKARSDGVYSYAEQGHTADNRTPCENSDEPDHSKTNLFEEIHQVKELTYDLLRKITNNFDMGLLSKGGRIIGKGGFGDVFLGIFENGQKCAVKRVINREESEKQFERERDTLSRYRHVNIVCLYAYSIDGPERCLVYEYLSNGSLEDRIQQKDGTAPISVEARVMILEGIAEGITFLNNLAYVHRDIKSANILLDENFRPKLGDFATARMGTQGNMTQALTTSVVVGTTVYLAPEAKFYEVSTKLDSYSYGVIILEVLTGLPPLDMNRKERDLMSYVDEHDISAVLDNSGGKWKIEIVYTLLEISEWCTAQMKKNRCNVSDILPKLKALS